MSGNGFVIIAVFIEAVILVAMRAIPTIAVAVRDDRVFITKPTVDPNGESRPQQSAAKDESGHAACANGSGGKVLLHQTRARLVRGGVLLMFFVNSEPNKYL